MGEGELHPGRASTIMERTYRDKQPFSWADLRLDCGRRHPAWSANGCTCAGSDYLRNISPSTSSVSAPSPGGSSPVWCPDAVFLVQTEDGNSWSWVSAVRGAFSPDSDAKGTSEQLEDKDTGLNIYSENRQDRHVKSDCVFVTARGKSQREGSVCVCVSS